MRTYLEFNPDLRELLESWSIGIRGPAALRPGFCSRQLVTSFTYVWISGQLIACATSPALNLWFCHPKVIDFLSLLTGYAASFRSFLRSFLCCTADTPSQPLPSTNADIPLRDNPFNGFFVCEKSNQLSPSDLEDCSTAADSKLPHSEGSSNKTDSELVDGQPTEQLEQPEQTTLHLVMIEAGTYDNDIAKLLSQMAVCIVFGPWVRPTLFVVCLTSGSRYPHY